MGFNTSAIILNDGLAEIAGDPDFGKKLVEGVHRLDFENRKFVTVSAGCHANPFGLMETHHADYYSVVAVGGNYIQYLGDGGYYRNGPEEILKSVAESMGYKLVRKRK
jgi:hypothetical protein